jgi:F420-non-reducing hydrogenase small subunit
MPDKPKVGLYWCASCGGCEESVVDLAEAILDLVASVDIVFWPVAMDFKKSDVEAIPDGGLAAVFINGAIRTSEQEEMARLLRRKSAAVIAYGSCAHLGGIPGLANQFGREELLRYVYQESPTTVNEENIRPELRSGVNGSSVTLPAFFEVVRTLDQVIDVDYYIPGCPPTPALLASAVKALLSGTLPAKGTVLAPDVALCDECPRKETKPEDLAIKEFRRPHMTTIDQAQCLLAQGIVCMGPATRGGCGAQCISGNMACTGCFGPMSHVQDQGAKMLSALASSIDAREVSEINKTLDTFPDPVGTLYRYGLPASFLRKRRLGGST